MHAAARVYGKKDVVVGDNTARFSLRSLSVGILALGLLMSAFGVIYAKDLNRRLFIQYHRLQQQQQHDQVEWSKLLLERGAWSTQTRIQKLAQQQLNMFVPSARKIIFIKDQ